MSVPKSPYYCASCLNVNKPKCQFALIFLYRNVPVPKISCTEKSWRQNDHVPECLQSQNLHMPKCPRDEMSVPKCLAKISGAEVSPSQYFSLVWSVCKSMLKTAQSNPLNEGLLTEDFFFLSCTRSNLLLTQVDYTNKNCKRTRRRRL